MAWNDGLEEPALSIAGTDNSPLRVLAGPGTGKSFAMKRRVARLLEEGVDGSRILVVTFTRTAAADLVEELNALGVAGCDELRVGTLHSFCFGLLSRDAVFQFSQRVPRPLLTYRKTGILRFEAEAMLADLLGDGFGGPRDKSKRILAFEAAWSRLQDEDPGWPEDEVDKRFHQALVSWLRFHRAMLVGELTPQALRYLRNNPEADAPTAFDHVVVDEYQDLNRAEQDLIDLLADNGRLSIVGDEDQSIYSFRHANPQGIATFHESHPGTHDESLELCRRCPMKVVAVADSLIRNNHPQAAEPRLLPKPDNVEGYIAIVQWPTVEDEVEGIADYVLHLVGDEVPPGDILILSPRKQVGQQLRDRLLDAEVPTESFYAEELLTGGDVQEAWALLTLVAAPEDLVAYRYLLSLGSPSGNAGEYARVVAHARATGDAPRVVLEAVEKGDLSLKRVTRALARHRAITARLADLEGLEAGAIFDQLFPPDQDWATDVRTLWAELEVEAETPGDILDALRGHVASPEVPVGDFVRIMSLHKSKGLTSRIVLVMSCQTGLMPFVDGGLPPNEREKQMREQRRLFYVAVTRTTETLVISSFRQIERARSHQLGVKVQAGWSKIANCVASPFLNELGATSPQARRGGDWRDSGYQ